MKQLLIVGMPDSGKSTFLAALRHLLIAKEVKTELELTVLSPNEAHLNQLEDKWIACNEVGRTKASDETWVELNLKVTSTGEESTIQLPDLRGETFELPASSSKCPRELHEALIESDGILLFTNADREEDALLIDDLIDMFDDHGDGDVDAEGAKKISLVKEATKANDELQFNPSAMPEETKIVELLQLANRRPQKARRRKIAILISAWDVIENAEALPSTWIKQHRPMLAQFIANNHDIWDPCIYGVSAQGGKLPDQKAKLAKVGVPTRRIRIVGHDAGEHDLTAPLRWLMSDK